LIKYDRLWETMRQRGISQYDLYTHHNINRSQLDRLRHNKNIEVYTIDKLCRILNCRVEDLLELEYNPEVDQDDVPEEK